MELVASCPAVSGEKEAEKEYHRRRCHRDPDRRDAFSDGHKEDREKDNGRGDPEAGYKYVPVKLGCQGHDGPGQKTAFPFIHAFFPLVFLILQCHDTLRKVKSQ